ncbi:hypothetical protein PpBr36_04921 [Pyricularia pennisetigena]|uniref:hypothetical protein n=1 Tax=Pyricularia pennisetigena TaxID=1578925 RepID=UPI001154EADF|nr:hypothetical protein PpBr36_04921 [Pyricularia pennisetigena]TLS27252.1 hypothetical protein PpBr36_04921 [Pyricularia pennisetigena]
MVIFTVIELSYRVIATDLKRFIKYSIMGVVVNIIKQITRVGGGIIISDVIAAINTAGIFVQIGNCNCVGAFGTGFGGGYNNLIGKFGITVDNISSFRVITAAGKAININPFFRGNNEEINRKTFAFFYIFSPFTQNSHVAPYTGWNVFNDFFYTRGDRKPAFTITFPKIKVLSWPAVWDLYDNFQKITRYPKLGYFY